MCLLMIQPKKFWTHWRLPVKGLVKLPEFKINLHVHQYELFKMLPRESIKDMYMHFTEIIHNLKSLGKTCTNDEKVRKVLQCPLRSKSGPKVTATDEAQYLKTLKLNELVGKLLTYEIHL